MPHNNQRARPVDILDPVDLPDCYRDLEGGDQGLTNLSDCFSHLGGTRAMVVVTPTDVPLATDVEGDYHPHANVYRESGQLTEADDSRLGDYFLNQFTQTVRSVTHRVTGLALLALMAFAPVYALNQAFSQNFQPTQENPAQHLALERGNSFGETYIDNYIPSPDRSILISLRGTSVSSSSYSLITHPTEGSQRPLPAPSSEVLLPEVRAREEEVEGPKRS